MADIGIDVGLLLQQLKPKIVQDMFHVLSTDEQAIRGQIEGWRTQLTSIIENVHAYSSASRNGNSFIASGRYNRNQISFTNMINHSSLVAGFAQRQEQRGNRIEFGKMVQRLFVIEHEIMDFLSLGQTATNTYSIYYQDKLVGAENILHKEISAKDLYENTNLLVKNKKGQITQLGLSLKQIVDNPAEAQHLTGEERLALYAVAQEAIKEMHEQLEALEKIRHKQHLYEDREQRVQDLRLLLRGTRADNISGISPEQMSRLMNYYMHGDSIRIDSGRVTETGKTVWAAPSFNRGHVFEALTRLFQSGGEHLTVEEAFAQSLGNDIWWSQGDVNDIQVKTMLGRNTSVAIASLSSIFELATTLLTILNLRVEEATKLSEFLDKRISADMAEINTGRLNANIVNLLQTEINELMSQFNSG